MHLRQYMKSKKSFLKKTLGFCVLLIFFLVGGCKRKEDITIIVPKVDLIDNYQNEKCILDLNIYTSINVKNIDIMLEEKNTINYNRFEIKLDKNNKQSEGLLHQFTILFTTGEIHIEKIKVKYTGKVSTYDIGKYICTEYENSNVGLTANSAFSDDVLITSIYNETYQTIYLDAVKEIYHTSSHKIDFPSYSKIEQIITNGEIAFLKSSSLTINSEFEQISNIIRYDFKTANEKEYVYLKYYLDKRPSLEVLRKTGYKITPQTNV